MIKRTIACFLFLLLISGPARARQTPPDQEIWKERLAHLAPNSLQGFRTLQDFTSLPPDVNYQILAYAWPNLPSAETKQALLNAFLQGEHPRLLDILHLGATDPSLRVQTAALQLLEGTGFRSFVEDYNGYLKWHAAMEGKPIDAVLKESAQGTATALTRANDPERMELLNVLARMDFGPFSQISRSRRTAALDAGIPDVLAPLLVRQPTLWLSFQTIRNIKPDEAYLRKVVLPLTGTKVDVQVRYQAFYTLASPENAWAASLLTDRLLAEYPDPGSDAIAMALGQIGDAHCVPTLIAMLGADDSPEGRRVLGNALDQLTGVNANVIRDAAWWRAWWDRNNGRFPPELRGQPLPKIVVRARAPLINVPFNAPAVPTVHKTLNQIANDPKRAYWLISPDEDTLRAGDLPQSQRITARGLHIAVAQPANERTALPLAAIPAREVLQPAPAPISKPLQEHAAHVAEQARFPGLLVVLVGGDGDGGQLADFWTTIARDALRKHYYIALAVAPKWSPNQSEIWITKENRKTLKEATFSVEEFAADIVKDVSAKHKVDEKRVFLHGVAEGGAAAYACALDTSTPFHGFYILSATFRTAQLPPLKNARGRRILIQHSPEDKVAPYWMAESARKLLSEQGANVKLEPEQGGHGYGPEDPAKEKVVRAFHWLEGAAPAEGG